MFYLVKKPLGISSNLVAKILKRVLRQDRVGFAGTLDPLATGLMIIGTAGSSRLFPLIDDRPKTYRVTMMLDGTTESIDLEKPLQILDVRQEIIDGLTIASIQGVIVENFLGEILQVPPVFSASWVDGQRAYDRARKGEDVIMQPKKRTIYAWEIVEYSWPELVSEITVSHGTYIRSLARDLGEKLQTGGYLTLLERTKIGGLSGENREWIQHNDIYYTQLSHRELFPEIPLLDFSDQEKTHLRLGSTPLPTPLPDGHYFVDYRDEGFGLLEAREGNLYPIKNCV